MSPSRCSPSVCHDVPRVCRRLLRGSGDRFRGGRAWAEAAGRSCLIVGIAAVLAVLVACTGDDAPAGAGSPAPAPEVRTVAAQTGSIEIVVRAVGQIRAVESVTLMSEVAGLVREIHFQEGSAVEAGDLLVELDATRARAELDSAIAVRDRAQRQLERFERAATTAAASITELDTVRTDLALAEAQYELARIRVQDHRIIAPFSGRVGLRLISTGSYIQPGTSLTTLTTVDPVDVEFAVPELYLAGLRPGLDVTARSVAYEEEFPATVRAVAPEVDQSTRSAMILARAPNPDGLLRPGMFVNVRLILGQREGAVLIPEAALQFRGSQASVFIVEDEEARSRRVRIGARRGATVEILEGVRPGDRIVVEGLQRIRDGSRVRASAAGPLAAAGSSPPAPSAEGAAAPAGANKDHSSAGETTPPRDGSAGGGG